MAGGGPGPPSLGALSGAGGREGGVGDEMAVDGDDMEDDVVPTVFRWEHGGRQVRRNAREGEGRRDNMGIWVWLKVGSERLMAMFSCPSPAAFFPSRSFTHPLLLLSSPPPSLFLLQVYIQGTFNNWERQIPMHRSGNDFTYIHNLKRGKHVRSGGLGRGGGRREGRRV